MRGVFALLIIVTALGILYFAWTGTNPLTQVQQAGATLKAAAAPSGK